jgi:transcriptional regulator with XRE-family HTH domain
MSEVEKAIDALRSHFAEMESSGVSGVGNQETEKASLDASLSQLGLPGIGPADATAPFELLRTQPAQLELTAYLASALTGLTEEQRQLVFQLSDTVALICEDLGIDLYEPRKKTDPVHHADVVDSDVFHIDRERVQSSDLLIHLAHFPSTGAGEELSFAFEALVPIVVVSHSAVRVSRMVTGIPNLIVVITYDEPEELRSVLRERLAEIRPLLVQRKLAFADYDVNIVGERIRQLRMAQGMTREDVAAATRRRAEISVDLLTRLEESTDRIANPTLLHLRELADVLKTSVVDLVEPDLEETIFASLSSWVGDRQAARFPTMSKRDRNKLVRRVLLRVLDSLEDD